MSLKEFDAHHQLLDLPLFFGGIDFVSVTLLCDALQLLHAITFLVFVQIGIKDGADESLLSFVVEVFDGIGLDRDDSGFEGL